MNEDDDGPAPEGFTKGKGPVAIAALDPSALPKMIQALDVHCRAHGPDYPVNKLLFEVASLFHAYAASLPTEFRHIAIEAFMAASNEYGPDGVNQNREKIPLETLLARANQ